MKLITNLLQRIQNRSAKQKNKKGASLALVMIAGTLLVIWVMCILPLMTTTGVAAYGTQDNMLAYLQNRSGIEYCKSELKFMVSESDYLGMPHSFAVVKENGKFVAYDVYQESGMFNSLVNSDFTPASSEVIAICEVEDLENKQHITITTWSNGKRGLTYTATYTGGGTLKILPESYRGNEALPLNDFVLVDGKLGSRIVWKSDNTRALARAQSLNFEEHLLGLILGDNLDDEYANAFQYPAVFKTTAHTTLAEGHSIAEEVTMGDLTSEMEWYYPQTENTGLNGGVYVNNSNQITVTTPDRNDFNIHKNVTFLYNGSTNKPTNGSYATTVHYPGTGANADGTNSYTDGGTNVLPFSGFEFQKYPVYSANINGDANVVRGNYTIINFAAETSDEQADPNAPKTFTVTIARTDMANGERQPNEEGLKYGYVINNDVANPVWQDEAVFTGLKFQDDKGKNQSYFFFVYKPATYENGTFHPASALKAAGMVFKPETLNENMKAGDYAIAAVEGNTYYFLKDDLSGVSTSVAGDTYGFLGGDALGGVTWTVANRSGKWNFRANNKYMNITAQIEGEFTEEHNVQHNHGYSSWWPDYRNCTKQTYVGYTIDADLTSSSSRVELSVARVGKTDEFQIYKNVSSSISYRPFKCNSNRNNNQQTVNVKADIYLDLAGVDSLASEKIDGQDAPAVKFIKIPSVPNASQIRLDSRTHTLASVAYRPGGIPLSEIITTNYGVVKQVYINGEKINGTAAILNAGYYNVVIENDLGWVNAGYLTVTRANYTDNALTITATRTYIETEPDDDVLVDTNEKTDYFGIEVKVSGFNPEGGFRYFGYRKEGTNDEFSWYPATTDSYTFRLNYGKYEFAVMETGSYNYVRRSQGGANCEIPVPEINLVVGQSERLFMFMMENNKPVWYRLPAGVYPDMVKMWYGYTKDGEATGTIDWETTYHGKTWDTGWFSDDKYLATYAVQVDYSNYPKSDRENSQKFDISLRGELDSPYLNNHGDSMLRGNSMYFMGNPSIDTHGCKVMLTTDLLVLNAPFESSDADGEGQIIVKKYDTSTGKPKEVLVFVPNDNGEDPVICNSQGIPIFEAGQFYQILGSDVGVDLLSLDPDDVKHVGDINNADVKKWFSTGYYPDLNLDIAYASRDQLARIVSSEVYGWTDDGVLEGVDPGFNESDPDYKRSDPDFNEKYVITTYVNSIEPGNHSYSANRILMAAGRESGYVLDIPQNMYMITRYLSIDADNVNGTGKFMVYNLGEVENYVDFISNAADSLGLTKIYSRTLQVDFERPTFINNVKYNKQISRFEHGTNLFGDLTPESVIVTYKDEELEDLMPDGILSWLSATLQTVDRYVSIVPAGEDKGTINIGSLLNVKLKLFANYVYFDERIETINTSALSDDSDVYFGAQETGYTSIEYLGLFTYHTSDSYTGTIIYVGNPDGIEIKYNGRTQFVIPHGIYRVENGTRLSDFGNSKNLSYDGSTKIEIILKFADKISNSERYQAGIKKLGNLSVYIDPKDGIYDETFVETGLDVNAFGGAAGFSGGTVE